MIPYATTVNLGLWAPTLSLSGIDSNAVLRSATLLVARAINENPYTVTPDQPRIDAVCAQATAWISAKLDPGAGPAGLIGAAKSKAVGGASVTYEVPTAQEREAAITQLAPDAYNILYGAGILFIPLPIWNRPLDTSTYLTGSGDGVQPATYNALNFGYGGY